jgi:hypothetical protein
MTTLYIKNLTNKNISIDGGGESPLRLYITPAVGRNYATIDDSNLVGDTVACNFIASLISESKVLVSVGSITGTSVSAASILKYASGTQWSAPEGNGAINKLKSAAVRRVDVVWG